jgi:hypothetical protein
MTRWIATLFAALLLPCVAASDPLHIKAWATADESDSVTVNVRSWSATAPPDSMVVFVRNINRPALRTDVYGWTFADNFGGSQYIDADNDSVGISVRSLAGYYPRVAWPQMVKVRTGNGAWALLGVENTLGLPTPVTPEVVSHTAPTWSHSAAGNLRVQLGVVGTATSVVYVFLYDASTGVKSMLLRSPTAELSHALDIDTGAIAIGGDYYVSFYLQEGRYDCELYRTDADTVGVIETTAAVNPTFTIVSSVQRTWCSIGVDQFRYQVVASSGGQGELRWRRAGASTWTQDGLLSGSIGSPSFEFVRSFEDEEGDCSAFSGVTWNAEMRLTLPNNVITAWVALPNIVIP